MPEKQVVKWGPFKDYIPDGVRVGNTIYLSGAVSIDDHGTPLHPGDIAAQARQAYANIGRTLEQFGATPANIVAEELFVTDMAAVMGDLDGFFAVLREFYGDDVATASQSLIQVAGLVMPELMIEIKVTAVV